MARNHFSSHLKSYPKSNSIEFQRVLHIFFSKKGDRRPSTGKKNNLHFWQLKKTRFWKFSDAKSNQVKYWKVYSGLPSSNITLTYFFDCFDFFCEKSREKSRAEQREEVQWVISGSTGASWGCVSEWVSEWGCEGVVCGVWCVVCVCVCVWERVWVSEWVWVAVCVAVYVSEWWIVCMWCDRSSVIECVVIACVSEWDSDKLLLNLLKYFII
jgi:hypothetical protein